MRSHGYTGIIGVQTSEHIAAAHWQIVPESQRQLMVAARLRVKQEGIAQGFDDLLPCVELPQIASLFRHFPGNLNLIHLSVDNPLDAVQLDKVLFALRTRAIDNCDGFEIATPWPSVSMLESYRDAEKEWQDRTTGYRQTTRDPGVIVVRTPVTINGLYPDPQTIVDYVRAYVETVNTVVLDFRSPGNELLAIDIARCYLKALYANRLSVGIGIAGGISAQNVSQLASLVREFEGLSYEADICLHGFDHRLEEANIIEFVRQSYALLV